MTSSPSSARRKVEELIYVMSHQSYSFWPFLVPVAKRNKKIAEANATPEEGGDAASSSAKRVAVKTSENESLEARVRALERKLEALMKEI